MTSYSRGDVILMHYPHSDLRSFKRRPALVVQADSVSTGIPQRVVAMITTNQGRTGPTRVPVRADSDTGRHMGLVSDSVVVTDNLATVLDREVDRVLGNCSDMTHVDAALRVTLGL